MRLTSGWARKAEPQELTWLQFYNKRKSGDAKKNFFVFFE